ncbi:MAG: hypothetical protein J5601_05935 [Elusimicrobiaceae bacterium]|nr:hypothetical protein [Elusimicrobiaceae bacterium]
MAMEQHKQGKSEIAQFLERFKEQTAPTPAEPSLYDIPFDQEERTSSNRSFERLEKKIQELEEKFEISSSQNELILSELAHTRESLDHQKSRDAFLRHISRTIASLKASVENLSRAQRKKSFDYDDEEYLEEDFLDDFDSVSSMDFAEGPRASRRRRQESEEKERALSSLRQKASQLKAVNSALDREIKKVQQEKFEALKKSAEQAKEILSLREQLTAAEEKFKTFDFEDRIVSVKQAYQQRVSNLETQLKEISDTCMKQVEEIESLKAENLKLNRVAREKDLLQLRLHETEQQVASLKQELSVMENTSHLPPGKLLSTQEKLQTLETQRESLSVELEQSQSSLDAVRQEKELLEKNFKELLSKINNNDAVIAQLKQKIEVLSRQNEAFAKEKTQLGADKTKLTKYVVKLNREKHELEKDKEEIVQENKQLRSQSAALLAAHLVHEKEQEDLAKAQAQKHKPQAPVLPVEKQEPSAPKGSTAQKPPLKPAEPSAPQKDTSSKKTSEDLPEIKVVHNEPEPDFLDGGEDFLEKTGNFFGRIKWSIFGEDK